MYIVVNATRRFIHRARRAKERSCGKRRGRDRRLITVAVVINCCGVINCCVLVYTQNANTMRSDVAARPEIRIGNRSLYTPVRFVIPRRGAAQNASYNERRRWRWRPLEESSLIITRAQSNARVREALFLFCRHTGRRESVQNCPRSTLTTQRRHS